ncbi:hypothetical protein F2P79_000685 [Pimephales promelas]|nr:hypothetical protein F2P79_000685 [Pimephales promelas]
MPTCAAGYTYNTQMNCESNCCFRLLCQSLVVLFPFKNKIIVNNMAACLVPDFPAVRIALEHLAELDTRLREEGVSFSQEASHHLRETAEAIEELESSRKTAREKLEVETIETSKLRHKKINLQDEIKNEISACVAAAREDNAAVLNQLQSELKSVVDDIQSMEEKQQIFEQENAVLLRERENIKGNYGEAVDQMNQQLSKKAGTKILLTEKQNEIQSLKDEIVQVEIAQRDLKENMIQKRKTFAESKHTIEKEIEETVLKIKEQRKIYAETRREMVIITSELQDKEETVTQCENHISQLEKNIAGLNASKIKSKDWLHEESSKTEELDRQK